MRQQPGVHRRGRRQLPAARSRLAHSVRRSRASRRRRGPRTRRRRRCTASARATSRRMGAELARGPRVHARSTPPTATGVVIVNEIVRHALSRRGGAVGRIVRSSATGIGPLGLESDARAAAPPPGSRCRTAADAFEVVGVVKDVRNVPLGQTRRAGDLLHDAAVSVPRAVPHGARGRSRAPRWRPCATGAEAGGAERADGARRRRGASASPQRTAEPRLLMTMLVVLRRAGGAARGARRLRPVLVVGGAAHARAGDPADARRQAGERRAVSSCARARCSSSPASWSASSLIRVAARRAGARALRRVAERRRIDRVAAMIAAAGGRAHRVHPAGAARDARRSRGGPARRVKACVAQVD